MLHVFIISKKRHDYRCNEQDNIVLIQFPSIRSFINNILMEKQIEKFIFQEVEDLKGWDEDAEEDQPESNLLKVLQRKIALPKVIKAPSSLQKIGDGKQQKPTLKKDNFSRNKSPLDVDKFFFKEKEIDLEKKPDPKKSQPEKDKEENIHHRMPFPSIEEEAKTSIFRSRMHNNKKQISGERKMESKTSSNFYQVNHKRQKNKSTEFYKTHKETNKYWRNKLSIPKLNYLKSKKFDQVLEISGGRLSKKKRKMRESFFPTPLFKEQKINNQVTYSKGLINDFKDEHLQTQKMSTLYP